MSFKAEITEYALYSENDLRALFPATHTIAVQKCLDHIDMHAAAFIMRAPYMCLGTQSGSGTADVSPRGDAPGFVRVLDNKTLAIPDRPGNNRLDSLTNIISNPQVGLLFMIPGYEETMRVNGSAVVTQAPSLLASMAVQGREPLAAIVVEVSEVFIHCAKALRRSRLWDASLHQDRREMPSLMRIIADQTGAAPTTSAEQTKLDADLEAAYRASMY